MYFEASVVYLNIQLVIEYHRSKYTYWSNIFMYKVCMYVHVQLNVGIAVKITNAQSINYRGYSLVPVLL